MEKKNMDKKLIVITASITACICLLIGMFVVPVLIENAEWKASIEPEQSMINNNPYIKFIEVGDEIEFGNDLRNAKDEGWMPLKWHVEKIEGIKAYMVLDDYLLVTNCYDCRDYFSSWDRTWINERFYRDWFSVSGKEKFVPSENGIVPFGRAIAGDKVFCYDARDREDGLREIKPAIWMLLA